MRLLSEKHTHTGGGARRTLRQADATPTLQSARTCRGEGGYARPNLPQVVRSKKVRLSAAKAAGCLSALTLHRQSAFVTIGWREGDPASGNQMQHAHAVDQDRAQGVQGGVCGVCNTGVRRGTCPLATHVLTIDVARRVTSNPQ